MKFSKALSIIFLAVCLVLKTDAQLGWIHTPRFGAAVVGGLAGIRTPGGFGIVGVPRWGYGYNNYYNGYNYNSGYYNNYGGYYYGRK